MEVVPERGSRNDETAQLVRPMEEPPRSGPAGWVQRLRALRVPRLRVPQINVHKLLVTAYRVAGFSVLTFILLALGGYLSSQLFFLVNHSWISPTIVSPTDEHVMQVSAEYAERASQRDKVAADRAALVAQLADARRVMNVNLEFQGAFRRALQAELTGRKEELGAVQKLMARYRQARREIEGSNEAYAGMSKERLSQEKRAGLIENDQYVNGNYQLAQIANTNLSLFEREAQLDTRAQMLKREAEALDAALPVGSHGALSYDTLKIKQELSRSILESQRAADNAGALEQSIKALDAVIGRYDKILKALAESPYLLATEKNFDVAFAPYENLKALAPADPVYACRLRMFWCRRVGEIVSVLGSETTNKHPLANEMLRGQMVHINLTDETVAQQKLLFVRRPPLLF